MDFWRFLTATHISRANCAEIARDRLEQPAYKTFSIKRSFHCSLNSPCVQGILRTGASNLGTPLRIGLLPFGHSREMVAPSGVYECIVPNVSCWDR